MEKSNVTRELKRRQLNIMHVENLHLSMVKRVLVPESVEVIPKCLFQGYMNIEVVEFGSRSRLKIIQESAFANSGVSSVVIPASVEIIEDRAFAYVQDFEASTVTNGLLSSIVFEEGSKLVFVGKEAFSNTGLTRIVIPASVEVIGEMAFKWSRNLEDVSFQQGSKLVTIKRETFSFTGLKDIVIPKSVEVLEQRAFKLSAMESVTFETGSRLMRIEREVFDRAWISSIIIPKSVETIGKRCFYSAILLESVTFEAGSKLISIKSSAFSRTSLYRIDIPANVEVIGEACLWSSAIRELGFDPMSQLREIGNEALSDSFVDHITVPVNVTMIGERCFTSSLIKYIEFQPNTVVRLFQTEAFSYTMIRRIIIPASVETIGKWCFWSAESLRYVTFEAKSRLKLIEKRAFACTGIRHIELPSSVEVIGKAAFKFARADSAGKQEMSLLESVTFEAGSRLRSIGNQAFANTGLEYFRVPCEVTNIGSSAFAGCDIREFVIDPVNTHFAVEGSLLMSYDRKKLVCCFNELPVIHIPATTEEIEKMAFHGRLVEALVIPRGVKEIDDASFSSCTRLKRLDFESSDVRFVGANFQGIVARLTRSCGKNVVDAGVVNVTVSSYIERPCYAVDLESADWYGSLSGPGQWICLDFKQCIVTLTHYTIATGDFCDGHLVSWVVEASDDGHNWTEVDRKNRDLTLSGRSNIGTFPVSQIVEGRLVRLRMTENNSDSLAVMRCRAFELFGSLRGDSRTLQCSFTENSLDGIIAALTKECGGNVSKKGIVVVTAKTDMEPRNVLDFENMNFHYQSKDRRRQWIQVDFKNRRVIPTHYSIRSEFYEYPKSWVIQGSVDNSNWIVLNRQQNNTDLDGMYKEASFRIHSPSRDEYRYIRLLMTGKNHCGDHCLSVSAFEVFGTLIDSTFS